MQPRLSVQLLSPRSGATVRTDEEITVTVLARDLDREGLVGIGFVARRFEPGLPTIDSAAVQFAARADSTHDFVLRLPTTIPTNTQVDVYGIAFGAGGATDVSTSAPVTVVNCVEDVCR